MDEVTLFFVKPATLEETIDSIIGNVAANDVSMKIPESLPPWLGPNRTRIQPPRLYGRIVVLVKTTRLPKALGSHIPDKAQTWGHNCTYAFEVSTKVC